LNSIILNGKPSLNETSNDFPFTFSEDVGSHKVSIVAKELNSFPFYNRKRQICDLEGESKNLASATETKTVAGEIGKQEQDGKLLQFMVKLHNEGIKPNSAKMYEYVLMNLVSHGANLLDPESVKEVIANKKVDDKTKALAVSAYSKYLEAFNGTWKPPRYRPERKIPFLPTEKEVDCLINAAHKKLATYLTLLKETGMRAGEAWSLKWIDMDLERNVITLNKTEKHGTPRTFKVSSSLIAMLNALPKTEEQVFSGLLINFAKSFRRYRSRLAFKMQNPRLNRITFHTFRHFFATMEYYKTKSIRHVQERLGHKSILTTEIYTHLVDFECQDFYSATATTVEEAQKLIESGFRFECEFENVKVFRKPKGVL
jgi:integrase